MNQNRFNDFLDGEDKKTLAKEERQLADLFEEVRALEDPEPGPLYWANFNQRLSQKIQRQSGRRRWWLSGIGLVAAAAMALVFWVTPSPATELDQLSDDSLAFLHSAYMQSSEETLVWELGEGSDVIWDAYQNDDELFDAIEDLSTEDLLLLSGNEDQEG